MYPIKFKPIYKKIVWGGRSIEKRFNRQIPKGNIAESWEICCRNDGMSIASNGILENKTLSEIIELYKEKILGTLVFNQSYLSFPLLIKIIDAKYRLSVQVHPDNECAIKEGELGKNEFWYVLDAKPDAKLVYGLKKNTTKERLIDSIFNKNLDSLLNEVPVKPGDIFYIPSGVVHAILDDILLIEVQQNSNITYRLYDWERLDSTGSPRELHIDKALSVIRFDSYFNTCKPWVLNECKSYKSTILLKSPFFSVEEIDICSQYTDLTDGLRFHIYMAISGNGQINFCYGREMMAPGDTFLIPASMGVYSIEGNIQLLKIYI